MIRTNKLFLIGIVFAIFLIFVFPQIGTISNSIINYSNEIEKIKISSEDTTPPELVEFSYTPTTIDVSTGSQVVDFTLRLTDELSGVEWATWWIRSPTGIHGTGGNAYASNLISGTELDGIYQTTAEFQQYSEAGTWHIEYILLVDDIGNRNWIYEDELISRGFNTEIMVTGGPDLAAPCLVDFSVNPNTIDVSTGSQVVDFTLRLTDELSGVEWATWWIRSPTGIHGTGGNAYASNLISGTELDGIYQTTAEFQQYSEAGTWHIEYILLVDDVANRRWIYEDELINRGFNTEIEVISVPDDTTPPDLREFSYTPITIDLSSSSQEVTFTFRITDDVSGVEWVTWWISSPTRIHGTGGNAYASDRISGDKFDGIYQTNSVFQQYGETGTWHIEYLLLVDDIGNRNWINEDELINMGFLTVIEVSENQPPTADAGGPYGCEEGEIVNFDASESLDPDGDPLKYRWDFDGDGIWDTGWSTDPSSTYTWDDDYYGQVKVQVSDGTVEDTDETTVTVNNVAPMVSIDKVMQPFPDFILPSDVIEFYGSFFDPGEGDTHVIIWNFGDTTPDSYILTPTHAYAEAGEYTVTLEVTDDDGGSSSASFTITVESPEEAAEEIIEDVEELDLPGESAESLVLKLEVAQNSIEMGLPNVAINQINAFINQVEAMRGKKLTNEEADLLISAAQWLIDNLANNGS